MVGNICLPFGVLTNEIVMVWMKRNCHVHTGHILCTGTVIFISRQ